MLRLTLSAIALAEVLVTTHPGFADSLPAATADHVQAAAAAAAEQSTPSPTAWSPSSDAIAPSGLVGAKAQKRRPTFTTVGMAITLDDHQLTTNGLLGSPKLSLQFGGRWNRWTSTTPIRQEETLRPASPRCRSLR